MSKHSTHVIVTHPDLTPKAYAIFLEQFGKYLAGSDFAVAPYSQALQRKLKAHAKTGAWYI